MFDTSGTACLRILTRTELFEMVLITSDLDESADDTKNSCSVELFFAMIATSMFVSFEMDGV